MEHFVVTFPAVVLWAGGLLGSALVLLIGIIGKLALERLSNIERLLGKETRSIRRWLAYHGERHTRVETLLRLDPLPTPPDDERD
jgi:hypothetical protein